MSTLVPVDAMERMRSTGQLVVCCLPSTLMRVPAADAAAFDILARLLDTDVPLERCLCHAVPAVRLDVDAETLADLLDLVRFKHLPLGKNTSQTKNVHVLRFLCGTLSTKWLFLEKWRLANPINMPERCRNVVDDCSADNDNFKNVYRRDGRRFPPWSPYCTECTRNYQSFGDPQGGPWTPWETLLETLRGPMLK
jgi:hypothetical protein